MNCRLSEAARDLGRKPEEHDVIYKCRIWLPGKETISWGKWARESKAKLNSRNVLFGLVTDIRRKLLRLGCWSTQVIPALGGGRKSKGHWECEVVFGYIGSSRPDWDI